MANKDLVILKMTAKKSLSLPTPLPRTCVESAHSMYQKSEPAINDGRTMTCKFVPATPTSDFVIRSMRWITHGMTMPAIGRAKTRTRVGGEGKEDEAKNVMWQYGCCSSLHTVLMEINRTHTKKRAENPKIRRRRWDVGAVIPRWAKLTRTEVASMKGTILSSQNVKELEKKAAV